MDTICFVMTADKKEIESCKLKIGEMSEKLAEKSRQHQKLQVYEI